MGGGGKVTVGYKYYIGMHVLACHGPVDEVQEIRFADRVAWSGSITSSQTVNVSAEGLYGGEKREGGVAGAVDFMFGEATQGKNSYLQTKLGTNDIPGFRGVMSFVFKSFYFAAMNPYLKDLAIKMKRIPSALDAGTADISGDANPAHIIYEALTDVEWGMGYPSASIDTVTFTAAATAMYNEGMGLSLMWSSQDSIEGFMQTILDHINGVLYVDLTDGKFKLELIRDDYVVGNLPVFDESNIVEFESFERRAWGETVNELTVVYHDRTEDEDLPVTVQAMGNIAVQGGQIISQTRQYPGFSNATIALKVAQRDLNALSSPLAKVRIRVNRDAFNLNVGSPFVVNWPKYGIETGVFRLAKVNMGSLEDGHMTLEAVEDVFALPSAAYTQPQGSGWSDPLNDPQSPTYKRIEEAGYVDLVAVYGESQAPDIDAEVGFVKSIAAKPTADAYNYGLWTKLSTETDYLEVSNGDFSPFGTLSAALVPEVQSTINYENDLNDDLFEAGEYVQIEGEKCELISIDTGAKQMVLRRGILDTVPTDHVLGAPIFGSQYYVGYDEREYLTGEIVDAKILTRTGKGELALGDATADQYTMVRRKDRPYPPGNLQCEAEPAYTAVMMTSGSLDFTWAHRDRLQQTVLTDFVAQDAADIGPEAGTSYKMSVYGDGVLKSGGGTEENFWSWLNEAVLLENTTLDPNKVAASVTLEEGNRRMDPSVLSSGSAQSTVARTGGRWYFEMWVVSTGGGGQNTAIGVCNGNFDFNDDLGSDVGGDSWAYYNNGTYRHAGVDVATGKPTFLNTHRVMCAMDLETGDVWFGRLNAWNDGDPATFSSPSMTGLDVSDIYAAITCIQASSEASVSFVGPDIVYDPPLGFAVFGGGRSLQAHKLSDQYQLKDSNMTLVDDITATTATSGSTRGCVSANFPPYKSKWYAEFLIVDDGATITSTLVGATPADYYFSENVQVGRSSNGAVSWESGGLYWSNGSSVGTSPLGTYHGGGGNRVIGIACDDSTGEIWFSKDGVWDGDPAAGTGASITKTAEPMRPSLTPGNVGGIVQMSLDATKFSYAPPTGFEAAGGQTNMHRYWRMFGEVNDGDTNYLGYGDMWFYGAVGGDSLIVPTSVDYRAARAIGSSFLNSSYVYGNAFDATLNSSWLSSSLNITDEWVGWTFDEPAFVWSCDIRAVNSSSLADCAPSSLRFEYSDDGTHWFTKSVHTGETGWTQAEIRNFIIEDIRGVELHSEIRAVLKASLNGLDSFTSQDYTFRRADYGYSYGLYYGGV